MSGSISTLGRASHKHVRSDENDTSEAELREFELQAEQRYRQMIGADDSLNDAAKRARRNAERTPLTRKPC